MNIFVVYDFNQNCTKNFDALSKNCNYLVPVECRLYVTEICTSK